MHMTAQARRSTPLLLLLGAALVLAGCTAPKEAVGAKVLPSSPDEPAPGPSAGGGRVLNAAPRVLSFQGSLDRADNGGGSVEVFRAVVADDNAEADLASLTLVGAGPQRFSMSRTLAAPDLRHATSPGTGPDGWAVWDALPHDGRLDVEARFTYPYGATPGEYRWTLAARDAAGSVVQGQPETTYVNPVHVVEVVGAVGADGRLAPAEGWGGWAGPPGAENVRSVTFLKVVNRGTAPDQRFLVDFSSRDFVGAQDASWRVPLDGNVRFGWLESPDGKPPGTRALAWTMPSPDGSVALQFTQPGAAMYVAYEVVRVPAPLPSQTYHAAATVTAL